MTAALDEHTSQRILQMLRSRQQHSDLTIVWATHDRSLADSFADAILDLDPERS
jgi:ABC-type lipoprotein export system ATPase subunit